MKDRKSNPADTEYYWRVRTRLPERFGQACQVLARGAMNSCLVRFKDNYKVITSRNYIRRQKPKMKT